MFESVSRALEGWERAEGGRNGGRERRPTLKLILFRWKIILAGIFVALKVLCGSGVGVLDYLMRKA